MRIKKLLVLLVCAVLSCTSLVGCDGGSVHYDYTKKLSDNGKLITNPGMGWDFGYHANIIGTFGDTLREGDYLDDFPCDIVYFRLGWSEIEKEEGVFDWSIIDDVANEWVARGKRLAFRWCTIFPAHQDTPLWVRDKGAQGVSYNVNEAAKLVLGHEFYSSVEEDTWIPYYDDPIYLEYLERFLMEAASRYDGKDFVDFIDIGSVGSWGEGSSHGAWIGSIVEKNGKKEFAMDYNRMPEGNFDLTEQHMRLWRKCFPNTLLFAGDDMKGNGAEHYFEVLDELGLGVNDDSVQVPNGAGGRFVNTQVTSRIWTKRPVSIEHHPTTLPTNVYYQSLLESHASYARIHMNPYQMKDSSFTQRMSKKLGYRLVPSQVEFSELKAGGTMHAKITLKNDGAAPAYIDGYPAIVIADADGYVVAKGISEFNIKSLKVECDHDGCVMYGGLARQHADYEDALVSFELPNNLKGEYYVMLAVTDASGKATFNMPLDDEMTELGLSKMYKLAKLTI